MPYGSTTAAPSLARAPSPAASAAVSATPGVVKSGVPLELVPQLGHLGQIEALALASDGRNLVTASSDGSLKVWDVETSAMLRTFQTKSPVRSVRLMPDGRRALAGYQSGDIVLWDLATGEQVFTLSGDKSSVDALAIAPDGVRAYSGSSMAGSQLAVWDLAERRQVQSIEAHPYGIHTLALSADGRYLASGGGTRDGRVKIRDTQSFKVLKKLGNEPLSVEALAFSPDGKTLAVGVDKAITLWDVASGSARQKLTGHRDFVLDVAFSADGLQLISAAFDHRVRLWNTSTGRLVRELTGSDFTAAVFAADGRRAITGDWYGGAKLWDLSSGTVLRPFAGEARDLTAVRVTPDGKVGVSTSMTGVIDVWDLETGALLRSFQGSRDFVHALDVSRDGKRLLTGGRDKKLLLWDLATGKQLKAIDTRAAVMCAVFSPDGKSALACAGGWEAGPVTTLWSLESGKKLREFVGYPKSASVHTAAFSPDGARVVVSVTGMSDLFVFDVASGKGLPPLKGADHVATSLAFSSDGASLLVGITASASESALNLLDARTGQKRAGASPGSGSINGVAFSPDGKWAWGGGADRSLHLYQLPSLRELKSLPGHRRELSGVAVMPGGHAISASRDGSLRVWHPTSGQAMTLVASGGEWLMYGDTGYFDASRRGGALVASVQGLRGFPIDQLAAKNNRPDLVLGDVGLGRPDALAHFVARYRSRLKKLGLTEAALTSSYEQAPEAKLASVEQQGKSVRLVAELSSPDQELLAYNVYVNDVPLFAAPGKPVQGRSARVTEQVELMAGSNKLEIGVLNRAGVESLRDFRRVDYRGSPKGDLYFIGFGVSRYRNSAYDLEFPHKDVRDLADTLAQAKGDFNRVHTLALVDEQVTREGVRDARRFLDATGVEDTVVLLVAGHGLHARDEAADYYFATHEVDLARLPETAAPFSLLESLLQGLGARKKLLLLDTCESGDRDEEALETATSGGFRARGIRQLVLETGAPKRRDYLLDRERYIENDITRRTGAIVLSSSRGSERSFESSTIQNGAFTEELLRALTTNVADTDKNGRVSTDELRKYVMAAVPRATDGLQHPVVDRDNLDLRFELPLVKSAHPILNRSDTPRSAPSGALP
ncbi:MAG TPA: caspase family protein [Polyangiaceae bacterium]|nr:caspase family protein [Polyangiaceae bacterium]